MYSPFFITSQHKQLVNLSIFVATRKIAVQDKTTFGFSNTIKTVNHDVDTFKLATKTIAGKLKSCIPFTVEFGLRIRCAKSLSGAFSLIEKVDAHVKTLEDSKINAIARCKSEGDATLPKVFPSPLKRAKSSENIKAVKSNNIFIAVRPAIN